MAVMKTGEMGAKEFYAGAGFRLLEERDGSSRWSLDLTTYVPPTLPWLNVNPPTAPSNALDAVGAGQAREP